MTQQTQKKLTQQCGIHSGKSTYFAAHLRIRLTACCTMMAAGVWSSTTCQQYGHSLCIFLLYRLLFTDISDLPRTRFATVLPFRFSRALAASSLQSSWVNTCTFYFSARRVRARDVSQKMSLHMPSSLPFFDNNKERAPYLTLQYFLRFKIDCGDHR